MQKPVSRYFFPYEFVESNWRLWTFIIIIAIGSWMLIKYPVNEFHGYIDPFYSPSVLIVPIPGLFRLTCYAYRKDYHRHLFHHPLACENSEREDSSNRKYTGEKNAIFQFENLHRYMLYAGIILLPFFYYDFYVSLMYAHSLRIGSLIIITNAITLTAWTLSCHAFRHLIGGNIDCYSCAKAGGVRNAVWRHQSWWNSHHEALAWISLSIIFFTDLYLRGLIAGIPLDYTLFSF